MSEESTVFVVDDDDAACKSVCALVTSMGLAAKCFSSAERFLESFDKDSPGCLVTDVRMLGISGIELQEKLNEMQAILPVIVITAYARTSLTVRAMQAGAVTMLDKPYKDDELWDAIRQALVIDGRRRNSYERREELRSRISLLSPAEREVLELVVSGTANKVIANKLDISVRTVENRRSAIYSKMQASSVAELVRLVIAADMLEEDSATDR